MKIRTLLLTTVVVISIPLMAQSSSKTASEVFEKSGMKDQMVQFDAIILSKIKEKKSSFSKPEDFEQFKTVMTVGLNSKNAEKFFLEYLTTKTKEDSLQQVVVMLNDPFIQEFQQLEKEAASPSKAQEQQAFFQTLQTNPPAPERVKQLTELNKRMKTSELVTKMLKNMIKAMVRGANSTQPKEKQVPLEEIQQKLDKELPANLSEMLTNQIVAASIFTYKNVSDDKLNHYIEVWEKTEGKYCIKELLNAFDYSFTKMGEITGQSFSVLEKK